MWPALIAAGASLGSGAMAAKANADAREEAMGLIGQTVADLESIGIPPEEAMTLALEKMRSAGKLTPELEQNILQGQTEMKGIETDPRLDDAQLDALDQLRQLSSGGFSIGDKAALNESLTASANAERGSREAILQDMAQRGASTSGGAIAAQMMNQQGAASRNNDAALDTAAQGYQRALDAMRSQGTMAADMQKTQFGQKAQVANAQDIINQMNTKAMQQVQSTNVANMNDANRYNLSNDQRIMDANTEIANKEQIFNKQLPQQTYQNQLGLAQAKGNARSGQAQGVLAGGNQAAQMWGNIGAGVGQAGMAIDKSMSDKEEREKDRQAGISTR